MTVERTVNFSRGTVFHAVSLLKVILKLDENFCSLLIDKLQPLTNVLLFHIWNLCINVRDVLLQRANVFMITTYVHKIHKCAVVRRSVTK